MTTSRSITVSMDQHTVDQLSAANYSLFAFKAVQCQAKGVPVVWWKAANFSLRTVLTWETIFHAYSSTSNVDSARAISIGASYPIEPGDILTIANVSGTGTVATNRNFPEGISIFNDAGGEFSCGIMQRIAGVDRAVSAFTLYSATSDIFTPVDTVVLLFSTAPNEAGDLMRVADNGCVSIDLSAGQDKSLSYFINTGWNTSNDPDISVHQGQQLLAPLLIFAAGPLR